MLIVAIQLSPKKFSYAKRPTYLVTMKVGFKKILVACFSLYEITCGFMQPGALYHTANGTISFKSEAPLELIKASSADLIGLLDVTKNNFAFKVIMRSFKGFNSKMQQEHFNENYMESNKYPEASFKGKIIEDVDLTKDGTYSVRAKGNLMIHNVQQERIIKTDITVSKGQINLKSTFTVLLNEHNIPIPRVVYQKLANEIEVNVSATLEPR